MKSKHSGQNLAVKFRTDRDLKWDETYFVFWIDMKYFGHYRQNKTELTTDNNNLFIIIILITIAY